MTGEVRRNDKKEVVLAQSGVPAWHTSGRADKSHEAMKKFTDKINGSHCDLMQLPSVYVNPVIIWFWCN